VGVAAKSTLHFENGNNEVDTMFENWLFVSFLAVFAVVMLLLPLVLARVLAPRKPNAMKLDTYECGIETVGEAWVQFKEQYYVNALVFLLFDVEIIFLYPWAVAFDSLPLLGVIAGVLFIFLLGDGLVYAWRKGALEWE
jgi:NADH-quinone oxidoreductase subunit A